MTTTDETTPRLTRLVIGDDASSWVDAGFTVENDQVQLGPVTLSLAGTDTGQRGIIAWAFDREVADVIDGILTLEAEEQPANPEPHPNGVVRWDHLVVMSPDMDRTRAALAATGFKARRTRDYEMRGTEMQQTFFWMGDVILELVGPTVATGNAPASLWGLAFVSDDLDASVAWLGERSSEARTAVQPGRRIASLRHKELGISVPTAFMTPHVSGD